MATLDEYRKKWHDLAFSTTPVNRPLTERLISEFYKISGRELPEMKWIDTPWSPDVRDYNVYERVKEDGTFAFFTRLIARGRHEVEDIVHHNKTANFELFHSQSDAQVSRLQSLVWSSRHSGFYHGNFMWWLFYDRVYHEIGPHWKGPAFEDAFKFAILATKIAEQVCWWRPHREICLISERPSKISFSDRKDAAIIWGHKRWYMVDDVIVPNYYITNPEKVTLADCLSANVEVRRVALDIFGRERFLREAKGTIIDHDETYGTLWFIKGQDLPEDVWTWRNRAVNISEIWLLEVTNRTPEEDGTYKKYVLKVPSPEFIAHEFNRRRVERTARAAAAWTFGQRSEDYHPEVES